MTPFTLHLGDCIEVMRTMPDASVDSIVCDPPYELGFMGKSWDSTGIANNVEMWREALRVLKPGGHLLAFSGTRTSHRMVCAIEDAGFEIRDSIPWLYGSGFPKSLDVSKAIDKAQRRDYVLAAVELGLAIPGNNLHDWTKAEHSPGDKWWNEFKQVLTPEQWGAIERAVVAQQKRGEGRQFAEGASGFARGIVDITAPATDAARQWDGWGTALKPAHEPICVARKPLIGTVAANVLAHGTGALNIDACRVDAPDGVVLYSSRQEASVTAFGDGLNGSNRTGETGAGRWPANIIHDGSDEVLAVFPDAGGQQGVVTGNEPTANGFSGAVKFGGLLGRVRSAEPRLETDKSAARFFYCAKASRADRNDGCEGMAQRPGPESGGGRSLELGTHGGYGAPRENHHPTVKPTDLMAYLCRLVTPPGGTVLDPFMGSGSTGKACMREGFKFIGIDMTPEYVAIATARISHEIERVANAAAEAQAAAELAARQPDLFAPEPMKQEQASIFAEAP